MNTSETLNPNSKINETKLATRSPNLVPIPIVQNVLAEHICVEIRNAFASAVEPADSALGERALLNCRERERESGHCVHAAGFVCVVNVSLLCIACKWGHIDVCTICIESMQMCKCIRERI
jgi:hypothetical protein